LVSRYFGSVRLAFDFFQETMWQQIKTVTFTKSTQRIKIEISELENSSIPGAAALYYDSIQ
jgi:glucokinase